MVGSSLYLSSFVCQGFHFVVLSYIKISCFWVIVVVAVVVVACFICTKTFHVWNRFVVVFFSCVHIFIGCFDVGRLHFDGCVWKAANISNCHLHTVCDTMHLYVNNIFEMSIWFLFALHTRSVVTSVDISSRFNLFATQLILSSAIFKNDFCFIASRN